MAQGIFVELYETREGPGRMSVTVNCTEECERVVECTTCKRRKPPIGRDVAAEMSASYCEHECPGHDQEPHGGHLWPGELARSREA